MSMSIVSLVSHYLSKPSFIDSIGNHFLPNNKTSLKRYPNLSHVRKRPAGRVFSGEHYLLLV